MTFKNYLSKLKDNYLNLFNYIISREWLSVLALTIFFVIVGSLIGIEISTHLIINHAKHAHYLADTSNKLDFFANWDGADYLNIAKYGYTTRFLTGWLPVYPLLIRLVYTVAKSYLISGLIISWVSLFGAIYYYLKVIKLYFKPSNDFEALKATLLFVLYPTGVYLLAVYTESLFAFLSLAAVYYAMQKKYIRSGLFTMVASATHINGLYLILFVALLLWENKQAIRDILITLILDSLGLVSYMVYLYFKFNNPLAYISAQRQHGWLQGSLLSSISNIGVVNLIFTLVVLIATIYWWNRKRSFSIYVGLYLILPLVGGQFGGYPRYTLMVFPLQYMLYEYSKGKWLFYPLILAGFSLSWLYILIKFATGYIVS